MGDGNRHIGETNMNEKSSRSHTIFRMVKHFSYVDIRVFWNRLSKVEARLTMLPLQMGLLRFHF